MDHFSPTNLLTLVIALLAAAATWGGVLWRMGRVEKDVEGIEKAVEDKMKEFQRSRELQGDRLGEVEKEVRAMGVRIGFAGQQSEAEPRRRKPTRPVGEKL